MYHWTITKDYLATDIEYNRDRAVGPRSSPKRYYEVLAEPGEYFRMLDDDGKVYYEGKIVGDYDGFEPLDDLGTPDAGCTEIQYWDKEEQKWITL